MRMWCTREHLHNASDYTARHRIVSKYMRKYVCRHWANHNSLFRKLILRIVRRINLRTFHVWKMHAANSWRKRLECVETKRKQILERIQRSILMRIGYGDRNFPLLIHVQLTLLNYVDTHTQTHMPDRSLAIPSRQQLCVEVEARISFALFFTWILNTSHTV